MKKPLYSLQTFLQCIWIAVLAVVLHYSSSHAQLVLPSGGQIYEEWMQGTNQKIQWDTSAFHGTLTISVWNRNTAAYTVLTTTASAAAGSYTWSIGGSHPTGNYFRIRIAENSDPEHYSMSGTFFAIVEDPSPLATEVGEQPTPGEVGRTVLYPNPTDDIVYFRSENAQISNLLLFDLNGTLVGRYPVKAQPSGSISTSALAVGTYLLQIEYTDGTQERRTVHVSR